MFIHTVDSASMAGRSIANPVGKGSLRAANPRGSKTPPMEIVGSCILPPEFAPVDEVFKPTVRVAIDLPYAVVLGTAFLTEHRGTISFKEGKWFRPTAVSHWVPFIRHQSNLASLDGGVTPVW